MLKLEDGCELKSKATFVVYRTLIKEWIEMWIREVLGYQNFWCTKEIKMGHKQGS
jgi:hypothetical protein